jgi:hypothetical protein
LCPLHFDLFGKEGSIRSVTGEGKISLIDDSVFLEEVYGLNIDSKFETEENLREPC